MKHILYNPLSGHGNSCSLAQKFSETTSDSTLVDMTQISDFQEFWNSLESSDEVYLFGGDGTLNRFINALDGAKVKNSVYYFPSGTGNDFCIDVDKQNATEPFLINDYIENLPIVTVDGKEYRFINGVGYGIDGYCCEVGDALKEKGYNPLNQIVGYILSEDPTYITNHNNARALIRKIDRDELLGELVKFYLDN